MLLRTFLTSLPPLALLAALLSGCTRTATVAAPPPATLSTAPPQAASETPPSGPTPSTQPAERAPSGGTASDLVETPATGPWGVPIATAPLRDATSAADVLRREPAYSELLALVKRCGSLKDFERSDVVALFEPNEVFARAPKALRDRLAKDRAFCRAFVACHASGPECLIDGHEDEGIDRWRALAPRRDFSIIKIGATSGNSPDSSPRAGAYIELAELPAIPAHLTTDRKLSKKILAWRAKWIAKAKDDDAREEAARAKQESEDGALARDVNAAAGIRIFAKLVRESGVRYPTDEQSFVAVVLDEDLVKMDPSELTALRTNPQALRDVIACHMNVLSCLTKPDRQSVHVQATDRGIALSVGGPLMWKTEHPRLLLVERLLTQAERARDPHDEAADEAP